MKSFYTLVLVVTFSTISLCATSQTKSTIFSEESVTRILNRIIDSLSNVNQLKPGIKTIELAEKYQQVEVFGDVKIFLTNDATPKLQLKGEAADLESIKVKIKNGKLIVDASKVAGSEISIYMSITDVYLLEVDGSSQIYSAGIINITSLQISLNETSMASIKYNGKLKVIAGRDAELIDINEYNKIVSRR